MLTVMSKDDRSALSWFAFVAAVAALCVSVFGLRDSGSAQGGGSAAKPTIEVMLKDFAFDPSTINIPTGGAVLKLMNHGAQVHNLAVPSLGIKSADVKPGATAEVDIPATPAGNYKVICPQSGHEGAGMVGALVVGGVSGSTDTAAAHTMSNSEMDAKMMAAAQLYPAKTAGHGGDMATYTMSKDGYKEFVVEAKIADWEVEPGKIVKA